MSKNLSHTFAEQLQARRAALLAHVREQRGGRVGRAEASAADLENASDDWAVADAARDMAFELAERESAELTAIADALDRISDGSYGLCGQCGAELPTARLHIEPTALLCVNCQRAREKAQGGVHAPRM